MLCPSFAIAGHVLGPLEPSYVIAEVGANHNRDLSVAREMIDIAADAGANAVKFQTYSGELIYSSKTPRFESMKGISDKPPAELLEEISLPREWQSELAEYARGKGIDFFSSPFDHDAVDELSAIGVPAMKIASAEIVDLPLIEKAASTGIPLLISTGMARLGEIEDALNAAVRAGATEVGLMQCASIYPAPVGRINLRAMETMASAFAVPVGLSDHSEGITVAIAAAARGAAFIEKHYTLDRTMKGPDHPFAIEPDEFRAMVAGIREAEEALGDGRKSGPHPEEAENYRLGRRSLIVVGDHPAGSVIEEGMLTVKRPGFGVKPKHKPLVVGRRFTRAVEHDEVLDWSMI
jgi:sialic acid synthase SpsE